MAPLTERQRFFGQVADVSQMFSILDHLTDVLFFVKNTRGQIMAGNPAFVRQMGGRTEADVLGKDAYDLCPQLLASQYAEDDQQVMTTGKPLLHRLELNQAADGSLGWFITHKMPLRGRSRGKGRKVIGLIGLSRNIIEAQTALEPYNEFNDVLDYVRHHYADALTVPDLAHRAGLSLSQFERRFKQTLGLTPSRYILRVRLANACRLLQQTRQRIAAVAQTVGFYDHSALTRAFTSHMGITPTQYRRQFRA
jgi:PAS domain S-box-containing protein